MPVPVLLSVASLTLDLFAYGRLGPPGAFGFLPLFLDYAVWGALGAAVGALAVSYAMELRGTIRIVVVLIGSLGIAFGLFFASLFLPVWVLYPA